MGRRPRIWNPAFFYHITSRGNRREALFLDVGDYKTFLYMLGTLHKKYPFELPSYCLMTNHYHLLLRSKEQSISKIMGLLNKRYADYYNNKYDLSGHLFEKRFYSKEVLNTEGILEVSRYIHRNPLEASMVSQLEDYPWSSYSAYVNETTISPPYLNQDVILSYFGEGSKEEKVKSYHEYCIGCLWSRPL
jgi:putative transposase